MAARSCWKRGREQGHRYSARAATSLSICSSRGLTSDTVSLSTSPTERRCRIVSTRVREQPSPSHYQVASSGLLLRCADKDDQASFHRPPSRREAVSILVPPYGDK